MRYEMRVTGYDMMDQVHVGVALYRSPGVISELPALVLQTSTQFPGTGTTSTTEWIRDALVALLEDL
jgi:hypothetical protein